MTEVRHVRPAGPGAARTRRSGDGTADQAPQTPVAVAARWSPWRAVVGFGVVSLAADMVYEGARSVTGPLLASLGASALLVGLVTGAGEALALVLRLGFGSLADRTGRYWALTLGGYALTAVCVPALALTPFVGAAGLVLACALVLAERTGKAVRSPSKSTLLAHAPPPSASAGGSRCTRRWTRSEPSPGRCWSRRSRRSPVRCGRRWRCWPCPGPRRSRCCSCCGRGSATLRQRSPPLRPPSRTPPPPSCTRRPTIPLDRHGWAGLPRRFWLFAASAGAATAGLVTFGVISYHLVREHVVPLAVVPVVYAAAMAAEAVAALATGWLYDRWNARVLLVLPLLVAAVPALAFSDGLLVAGAGILLWGAAVGVQDSTVKALVADLVPAARRATAYGWFAAVQGAAAVAGGAMAGALYARSVPALVAAVAATQLVALTLLVATLRLRAPAAPVTPPR